MPALPVDVLLVDDHPILHETLGVVVRSVFPEAQLHSEMDLGSALSKARQLKRLELVLLDLGLPGCSGIEALVLFRKTLPLVPVAIISGSEDAQSIRAALDAGAVGYLPKTFQPRSMAEALRFIRDGGTYVPPQAMGAVIPDRKPTSLADIGITERQADVLSLLAKGLPNSEIGRLLQISENTVKQHAHAAYRTLGVSSRTEAMAAMTKMGIKDE